jgi:hypothetical protein
MGRGASWCVVVRRGASWCVVTMDCGGVLCAAPTNARLVVTVTVGRRAHAAPREWAPFDMGAAHSCRLAAAITKGSRR